MGAAARHRAAADKSMATEKRMAGSQTDDDYRRNGGHDQAVDGAEP